MIGSSLALAYALGLDGQVALERARSRYASVAFTGEWQLTGGGTTVRCRYEREEGRHRVTISGPLGDWLFEQVKEYTVTYSPQTKTYYEHTGFDELVPPPPIGGLPRALPPFAQSSWVGYQPRVQWKDLGQQADGGVATEHLSFERQTPDGKEKSDILVDSAGRVRSFSVTMEGSAAPVLTYRMLSERLDRQGGTPITAEIPRGYSPGYQMRFFDQPQAGKPFPLIPLADASGQKADLAKTYAGKRLAVVLLDPESEPCQKMLAVLPRLKQALSGKAEVVAVSLGEGKPLEGTLWDKEGRLAEKAPVSMTPYVVFLDEKHVQVRAFAGFAEDQTASLLRTATAAYEPNPDRLAPRTR